MLKFYHIGCAVSGKIQHKTGEISMTPIRLIDWHPDENKIHAALLEAAGYSVDFSLFGPDSLRMLKESPPQAIIISLDRRPSQGRDLAIYLRKSKATRQIPLVLAGGTQPKVKALQEFLPDASYTTWERVLEDLAAAIETPLENPIIPKSLFAPYAGTPLPKKLGIKAGINVSLVDAPPDFESTLGDMPDNVTLVRDENTECDLIVWFVKDISVFKRELMVKAALVPNGPFWVVWPKKSSGVTSDLTQPIVRAAGLAVGLVDYKVCSVDKTWTGLCFRWRK
jgi:CheY-like chemotaxis protein